MAAKAFCHKSSLSTGGTSSHQRGNLTSKTIGKWSEIKAGKFDFDVLITTPDHIRDLAPVAKALGPKGLMPSPKAGTVAVDIEQAIKEVKLGKVEFRLDKTGNIHLGVGKISFDDKKLIENIQALMKSIEESKPAGVKGKLIKKVVISSTMSPAIMLDY